MADAPPRLVKLASSSSSVDITLLVLRIFPAVCTLFGILSNLAHFPTSNIGSKYVRLPPSSSCPPLASSMYMPLIPLPSPTCCLRLQSDPVPCPKLSYKPYLPMPFPFPSDNFLSSRRGSITIPVLFTVLIPLLFTFLTGDKAARGRLWPLFKGQVAIILVRVVILYSIPLRLERLLGDFLFDWSDHIVLYYSQILPLIVLHAVNAPPPPISKLALLFYHYSYSVIPAIYILALAVASINTATYYHTPFESVSGLGVVYFSWWLGGKVYLRFRDVLWKRW